MTIREMLKQPSAFLPVTMSGAALATVLIHLIRFGPAPEPDEGAAAHIFQLLIAAEFPLIVYFAAKWLPSQPRPTATVLAIQFGAVIAAFAPVFLLGW